MGVVSIRAIAFKTSAIPDTVISGQVSKALIFQRHYNQLSNGKFSLKHGSENTTKQPGKTRQPDQELGIEARIDKYCLKNRRTPAYDIRIEGIP